MLPRDKYKSVQIHITTYNTQYNLKPAMNMDERVNNNNNKNKFNRFIFCDLCLKGGQERENVCKRAQTICPVCHKSEVSNKHKHVLEENKTFKAEKCNSKEVQTTLSEVNPNVDLLDEVLKVFKSKKDITGRKEKDKAFKDVETSTNDRNCKAKLTRSKVFLCSIGDNRNDEKLECTVVNSYPNASNKSVELLKHKSSSIPQMKMDELKYALREKTKSKDSIEEVNRMFATVRRYDSKVSGEGNRPTIRLGPRILPVVKTKPIVDCKYCQVNCMSSGDSAQCCHRKIEEEKCDKCVYMLCCHYKNNRKQMENNVVLCESCNKKQYCDKCSDSNWDNS